MPETLDGAEGNQIQHGRKRRKVSRKSRKKRVTELLKQIEGKLNVEDMKVTLGDFIRLMQLERELDEDEQPREIIVTWKDPSERHAG